MAFNVVILSLLIFCVADYLDTSQLCSEEVNAHLQSDIGLFLIKFPGGSQL
jgi:hypothetical protein